MICISCPIGCRLSVQWEEGAEIRVSGNQCDKGESYGREEALSPKRVVTATVRMKGSPLPRLPVKTSRPLPKEHITALLQEAYLLELEPPVWRGQIVMKDFRGTGIDLVATRTVEDRDDG